MITEELATQLQKELAQALIENNQLTETVRVLSTFIEKIGLVHPANVPLGLLVSMALRLDINLLSPRQESEEERKKRLTEALHFPYRAIEELLGNGYWSRERDEWYRKFILDPRQTATPEEIASQIKGKARHESS
jgi:hypothetical protein